MTTISELANKTDKCPKCGASAVFYDGCLGYEALKCGAGCGWEYDLNTPDNVPPARETGKAQE